MLSIGRDAAPRLRHRTVPHSADHRSRRQTTRRLCRLSTALTRVRRRSVESGEADLVDQRGDNGQAKISDDYLIALIDAVEIRTHGSSGTRLLRRLKSDSFWGTDWSSERTGGGPRQGRVSAGTRRPA